MLRKENLKRIAYLSTLILIFCTLIPLFNIKVNAYTTSSEKVEKELKRIVSTYGEENVIFEDGLSIYLGEEVDLSDSDKFQGVTWKSENNDILKIEDNKLVAINEGTTFLVGTKDGKYYLKEVYVSTESISLMSSGSTESKASSQYVVYIDPGHGGTDPGASGNGIVEKTLVLNVALKLKEKLEANGIKVIMSRTSDVYVSLEDRSKGANNAKPDLFISIHINSAGATSASGIETYYYKSIDKPLAQSIQSSLISYTGAVNRGAKWEEFYVVKNTNMPEYTEEYEKIINKFK